MVWFGMVQSSLDPNYLTSRKLCPVNWNKYDMKNLSSPSRSYARISPGGERNWESYLLVTPIVHICISNYCHIVIIIKCLTNYRHLLHAHLCRKISSEVSLALLWLSPSNAYGLGATTRRLGTTGIRPYGSWSSTTLWPTA